MRSQAFGLTDAMGLAPRLVSLAPRQPWRSIPARFWPLPLRAIDLAPPPEPLAIGCAGKAAPVLAALRRRGKLAVQIQHPRMDPRLFDQVVVSRTTR